jgi:lysophospholipase L1-like esterase
MKLPMQCISKKIVFCTLIIALLWLCLEFYAGSKYSSLRQQGDLKYYHWDAKTCWRLRPSIDATVNRRRVHTNSAGLRGQEEYLIDSQHALRILTLGDSRSYGLAVADQFTYSHVLQDRLQKMSLDAQVINAGTPGYSIVQCHAKLEQLLAYKPDIAILAAGYNDRRYLLLTPPDTAASFGRMTLIRNIIGFLQHSNLFYAASYHLGKNKLDQFKKKAPSLDQVKVRVNEYTFRQELNAFIETCRQHDIKPILLMIDQNPSVFEITEQAAQLIEKHEYQDAIELLESNPDLHIAAAAYRQYLLGVCYQSINEKKQANQHFNNHKPIGSLHGEAILRSQKSYFDIIQEVAKRGAIPALRSRTAIYKINQYSDHPDIKNYLDKFESEGYELANGQPYKPRVNNQVVDLENFFRGRLVDESHYDQAGHILIGTALAELIQDQMN